jgi:hypothetical protein
MYNKHAYLPLVVNRPSGKEDAYGLLVQGFVDVRDVYPRAANISKTEVAHLRLMA